MGYFQGAKVAKSQEAKRRLNRKKHLKRQYGLSLEDFERLNRAQKGRCAICGEKVTDRPLDVDHCHKTNRVRGLLCHRCNLGLYTFKDDPYILRIAVAYLERTLA